jgi:hypothetical protein
MATLAEFAIAATILRKCRIGKRRLPVAEPLVMRPAFSSCLSVNDDYLQDNSGEYRVALTVRR